jgi:hypothetical protein
MPEELQRRSEVRRSGSRHADLALAYGLQPAGFQVICMEASQFKNTLAAMRNKTDRNDARGIAQILRTRLVHPIRMAWANAGSKPSTVSMSALTIERSTIGVYYFLCWRSQPCTPS